MHSRFNTLAAVLALAGVQQIGGGPVAAPVPFHSPRPRFSGSRRRDTKPAFDRAHVNRRRKLALASKRRNR